MSRPISERKLVFLLGAVQFVNVMDFMMVMPLGPDFAKALAIPTDLRWSRHKTFRGSQNA